MKASKPLLLFTLMFFLSAHVLSPTCLQSTTTTRGGCINTFDGTSSATPYVSAVIALVLDAK